jgi:hypothetical protein
MKVSTHRQVWRKSSNFVRNKTRIQGRISHKGNLGHGLGRSRRGVGAYIQKYCI